MYPSRELKRLEAHKAWLLRDIARHRANCATAATRLARPLDWVDKAWGYWRKFSPLAKVFGLPLGAIAARAVFKRLGALGSVARWAPLIFNLVRGFKTGASARS
jgi:hypothetical protein